MNYCFKTLLFCALFTLLGLLVPTRRAGLATGLARPQQQNVTVSTNEGLAMKSLRALLSAEAAFQSTIGKGEYGYLLDLHQAGLIDKDLASGIKDSYLFTIVIKKSTMTTHAAIDLVARPAEYGKTGRRSFYLTESGVMLTSEEKDAPLATMRPFAAGVGGTKTAEDPNGETAPATDADEDEIANRISANEASVIAALGAIHSAETKYIAKAGAGAYGSLEQLEKAGLIDKAQTIATQHGYLLEVKISAGKPESPATFRVSAVPQTYGTSGRRSFFMDQSGIVRGDDKEGGIADQTDPPLK